MNKRPGQVVVTTEVGFCTFCGRPRTLRREERQLGTLVRTVITCESCHRTLSSTIGVAGAEPAAAPEPAAAAPVEAVSNPPVVKRAPAAAKAKAKAMKAPAKAKTTKKK